MAITKLEDLDVFRVSKQLNLDVYPTLRKCSDFAYRDQMTRSCLSVVSNIAEGYGRFGNKEFHRFLTYSSGSAHEFLIQFQIASELGIIRPENSPEIIETIERIKSMLYRLMKRTES